MIVGASYDGRPENWRSHIVGNDGAKLDVEPGRRLLADEVLGDFAPGAGRMPRQWANASAIHCGRRAALPALSTHPCTLTAVARTSPSTDMR
jgi:hypothetical protein